VSLSRPPVCFTAVSAQSLISSLAMGCGRFTRTSSFHSLSPPVLSPAYDVELSQSVPLCRGRAASSQRAASPPALSVSPSQSTFSYGAPSPPVEYPAARPSVFRPSLIDIWANADPTPLPRPAAGVDRARPVAASVDVSADIGRTPLPYANVDVDVRRPGSAAGPRLLEPATSMFVGAPSAHLGSLDVASSRTRMRSDTPMPLSDVGQRGLARPMRINMPRPLDLTLSIASDVA